MFFAAFPLLLLIFSLYLIFVILFTMCLGVFFFGLILYGTLFTSWTSVTVSCPRLGMFSAIMSSNIFSGVLSLSSPSGTPIMQILLYLMLTQKSLKLFSFLFILFPSFSSAAVISTTLSSSLLIHSFVSFSLLLSLSSIFFIQLLYSLSLFDCFLYFLTLC